MKAEKNPDSTLTFDCPSCDCKQATITDFGDGLIVAVCNACDTGLVISEKPEN